MGHTKFCFNVVYPTKKNISLYAFIGLRQEENSQPDPGRPRCSAPSHQTANGFGNQANKIPLYCLSMHF